MALALAGGEAQAQAPFPSAPFRLVVPFAAGGPTDVVARILAELLSARWGGHSVIVENRPGAGTIVATAAVAKALPDGHTVLIAHQLAPDQPGDRPEAALRYVPRARRRQHDRHAAGRAGGEQGVPGEHHSGADQRGQDAARAAQLRLARPARRRASGRRDAEDPRRHRHDAYQLQRQHAGAHRRDRLPRADHVRRVAFGQALRRVRRAQADRRCRRCAPCRPAERADHRRDVCGLRRHRLQRHGGAGGHADARKGEARGRHKGDRRVRESSPPRRATSAFSPKATRRPSSTPGCAAKPAAGRRSPRRRTSRRSDGQAQRHRLRRAPDRAGPQGIVALSRRPLARSAARSVASRGSN